MKMTLVYSRAFLATVLVVVLSLQFGCTSDVPEGQDRKIRFWHFWSEPGQQRALDSLIKSFEKKWNVDVELTALSWNDGKMKLQAAFNSGAPPDVLELGSDWISQFSSSGVLLPLPADANALSRFVSYAVAPGMWQGKAFAYPWTLDTRVIWVNRGLLSRSGWTEPIATMQDLKSAALACNRAGNSGWGASGADAHRLYKKILPFFWTFGGDIFDARGRPVLNSAENIRALTFYAELARTGIVETQRQLDASFIQGNLGLWNSGSWLIAKVAKAEKLNASPIIFPGIDGKPGVSFAGGEYLAVSAKTSNTQIARELVLFLTSGANSIEFCRTVSEAGFPADKAWFNDSSLVANPHKSVFARQLEFARMTPVHPRWLDIEAVIETAVVKVLLGENTPEEALEEAQREVEFIVAL